MRLFLVNLLAIGMLVMPLHASVLAGCDCTGRSGSETSETEPADGDGCCRPAADGSDEDPAPDRLPCDDGDCPASCCASTAQPVFVPPTGASFVAAPPLMRGMIAPGQSDLAPPHLTRLKRPPRTV